MDFWWFLSHLGLVNEDNYLVALFGNNYVLSKPINEAYDEVDLQVFETHLLNVMGDD